jgi:hypothetical protein
MKEYFFLKKLKIMDYLRIISEYHNKTGGALPEPETIEDEILKEINSSKDENMKAIVTAIYGNDKWRYNGLSRNGAEKMSKIIKTKETYGKLPSRGPQHDFIEKLRISEKKGHEKRYAKERKLLTDVYGSYNWATPSVSSSAVSSSALSSSLPFKKRGRPKKKVEKRGKK